MKQLINSLPMFQIVTSCLQPRVDIFTWTKWCQNPFSGARDRMRRNGQEAPPHHEEQLLYLEGGRALQQLPREGVEFPLCECSKSAWRCSHVPCSRWPCLGRGVLHRSLPTLPPPTALCGSLGHPILLDTSLSTVLENCLLSSSPGIVWKQVWAFPHCCIACHFLLGLLNKIMF